jgi:hypothetical protein
VPNSFEQLQVWIDEFGEGVLAMWMPFKVPSGDQVLQRVTGPTISGTGVAGTAHTVVAGTFNLTPPPITYEWFVDGTSVGTGTSYTPPTATTADGALLTVVENVAGLALMQATSPTKAITNATSIPWPASLAASKILWIGEITDTGDPNYGAGGRCQIQMDTFTIPTDFEFWVNSTPEMDGSQMTGATKLTGAGSTAGYKRWNNSLAAGTKTYMTGFWKHVPTGGTRHAFANSGTTGNGKTLEAIVSDPSYGQEVVTIGGTAPPATTWPAISTAAKNDAIAQHDSGGGYARVRYFETNPSSGGSTANKFGHTATVLAMCAFNGDTTVYSKVKEQLDYFLVMENHPVANGGVGSQHELYFPAFFTILRKTPAIWGSTSYITAAQKSIVDCIIEGILYDAAYLASDTRSGGDAANGAYRMQRGNGHDAKNKGSDLSFPICARLQCAASWFGITTAKSMVNSFSRSAFRSKMQTAFGAGYANSNMYRTYNWRNLGITVDDSDMAGTISSEGLTDAQHEEALHKTDNSFRYFTKVFEDFEGQVTDQTKNGSYMTKTLLPYDPANASHGTMKYWGWSMYGLKGNVGVPITGKGTLGIIENTADGPGMPFWSGAYFAGPPPANPQRMFYNLNGQDDKGARSSISYAAWDMRFVLTWLLCQEMNGTWADKTTPLMSDCLRKTFDALANYFYLSDHGYESLSHGGSTGGGGGPITWPPGGPADWRMTANKGLADCIRGKMGY